MAPAALASPLKTWARRGGLSVSLLLALCGCASSLVEPEPAGTEPALSTAEAIVPSERPAFEPESRPADAAPPFRTAVPGASSVLPEIGEPARAAVPVVDRGLASWYGGKFHGRRTASGERYDKHAFTAAHRTLPFGTRVRVRSVHSGREVVVRINDRGPFKRSRIIDLSQAAFSALGLQGRGVTQVELLPE